jgi:pimeloyl-ACP methyl ester carboxylesterase
MRTLVFILFGCQILLAGCAENSKELDGSPNHGTQVRINDIAIYYEQYGQGVPLLVLSGGGLGRSIRDFDGCIPDLANHFRVIAPDSPGQGRSGQPDRLSYSFLADTMSRLLDSLQLDSVYVMGLSDGAIVALLLADQRGDKVRKVVAVGANNGKAGFVLPEGFPLDSVKVPTVDQWARYHEKDIDRYKTLVPAKDWRKQASDLNQMWYADQYFPESTYDRIHVPVMIVLGDRDDISIDHGLDMHRKIKSSQFCVLPNTSHEVFAERPELITKIAIDFFNE